MIQANKVDGMSPAYSFLEAAKSAMPRTIGDRVRIEAMSSAMDIAVRCRFRFDKDDGPIMTRKFRIETCVGVFLPIDMHYYRLACETGGTYARMWETHRKIKPWIASHAVGGTQFAQGYKQFQNNRVSEGMAVLLSSPVADDDPTLARDREFQVWWVTSLGPEELILCRYRYTVKNRHRYGRSGSPAKRRKIDREEWVKLNPVPDRPPKVGVDHAAPGGDRTATIDYSQVSRPWP